MAINYKGDPTDSSDDTPFDALKCHSLKAAGIAYLVGDSALSAARLLEGDRTGAAGGGLWALGSIACARYASPSQEKQLKLLSHRLGEYLQKEGVLIPQNADTAALTKTGGVIDHIESFLYAHPSEILNAVYAVGGALVAKGGIKNNVKSDIACGALIVAGGLAGLLIPEVKPDPQNPPKGTLESVKSWMLEKPLRVSSAFYHVNNIFTVIGAFEQKKANPTGKSHYLRFITAASFIFANTMLAMSSKGHSGSNDHSKDVLDTLATTSAQVIAAQPQELREMLLEHIAAFLSVQPEVTMKAEEISALLHVKLQDIQPAAQSWVQRMHNLHAPTITPSM